MTPATADRADRLRRSLRRLGFTLVDAERRGRFQIRREGSKVDEAWIRQHSKCRPGRGEWTSSIRCAHVRTMSDKALPAGWVVQVTTPGQSSSLPSSSNASRYNAGLLGAPSFSYFNAAIAVAGKAIEAAKHFAEAEGREAHIVRSLSSGEIAALGLAPGEVKPA